MKVMGTARKNLDEQKKKAKGKVVLGITVVIEETEEN